MKKLILFIVWLILFSGYLLIIPEKTLIMAAITEVSCNAKCQFSYGVKPPNEDWQGNETVASQCGEECPSCRTKQLNLESAQVIGMDCQYTDTCYCYKEDFGSIHEDGPEVIVDPVKPITETGENELSEIGLGSLVEKVNKFLPIAMGLGGVIAFILIVIGGFQIILSAGNPDKVKAGQEMITSAIAGLLLIIFSIFILRLIGYDILQIPDFG